jgi:hypothetical protein
MTNNYNTEEKATYCHDSDCFTVYGQTAQFVNGLVVAVAVIAAVVAIVKALE